MLTTWDEEATPPGAKRLVAREAELFAGERAGLRKIADTLVEERLLTRSGGNGGATLEVAHEALLRQPPLSRWLEESQEFLIWRKRLARAREAFDANERGPLTGRELQIARGWVEAVPHDEIAVKDHAFIAQSEAEDDRIRAEEAERERQRQVAELEAANARAEIAERDRRLAELEAAQARDRAATQMAEAVRAREQAALEAAEAARLREQAAQATAAVSRRIAQRTLAGLAAALVLALVSAAFGMYAWHARNNAIAAQNEALGARNEAVVAQNEALRARNEAVAAQNEALGARNEAVAARNEALLNQSRFLADHSRRETNGGDPVTGLLLALEALPDATSDDTNIKSRPIWPLAAVNLDSALRRVREVAILKGHEDSILSIAVTPDGARIVSGSDDKTVRIWDAKTFAELVQLKSHESSVLSIAVTPDSSRIVSGADDNTVRIWEVFPAGQALVEKAKTLTQRCLTPAQRQLVYLPPAPPRWCIALAKWPYDLTSLLIEGQRLVVLGEDAEAKVLFDEALKQDSKLSGRIGVFWANAYIDRGRRLANDGKNDEAIELFDLAIQREPKEVRFYNERGNAYFQQENYARAIADYDQAIQLNPRDAVSFNDRANAYWHKKITITPLRIALEQSSSIQNMLGRTTPAA